jgi:hypothetical protein
VPGAPDFMRPEPLAARKPEDNVCIAYAEERFAHRKLNSVVMLGRGYMDCVAASASGKEAKACEAKTAAMAQKAEAVLSHQMKEDLKTAPAGRKCGKAAS